MRDSNAIVDIPATPHVRVTDKLQYFLLYHTAYYYFQLIFVMFCKIPTRRLISSRRSWDFHYFETDTFFP